MAKSDCRKRIDKEEGVFESVRRVRNLRGRKFLGFAAYRVPRPSLFSGARNIRCAYTFDLVGVFHLPRDGPRSEKRRRRGGGNREFG